MERSVGDGLEVAFDAEDYRPDVVFVVPEEEGSAGGLTIQRPAVEPSPDAGILIATLDDTGETGVAGVYEAWLSTTAGTPEVERFALNVDRDEGDTRHPTSTELLPRLAPLDIEYHRADQYGFDFLAEAGTNRSLALMGLLIALLLVEQLLAYLTSYHPARGAVR